MLSFDEREEIFFDSVDYLSSEESLVEKQDLLYGNLGIEIWLKEPQSVKERRESFLREMGFVKLASSHELGKEEPEVMGLERIVECSGAVSSCCASLVDGAEKNLVCHNRELNGEANCAVDEYEQFQVKKPNVGQSCDKECNVDKKKLARWWKHLINKRKRIGGTNVSKVLKPMDETPKVNRMNVRQNKKRCKELTAVYTGQEIHAHEGSIWTMKFSPDGQYLASGGEDGVIRIWRVMQTDASCKILYAEGTVDGKGKGDRSSSGRKKSSHFSVVIPEKVLQIEELPLQEFHGHTSDVLDLAWTKSNCLLSSSKDKSVRLWQVGCNECLGVFQHTDYVTCIQFNPVDEHYFISGSIDGKVRIWGVLEQRVVCWADVRDIVTAICYRPDGKGFIVGSITGTCSFYGASDGNLQLNEQLHFRGRKRSSSNKITGIQFTHEESQRVLITSEDSKVRILDGIDIVRKYKGLAKSGSQMSASFTSTGRHLISVGKDSRVYLWNYDDDHCVPSSKQTNSVRSCEHFFSEGVSVAIPWSSTKPKQKDSECENLLCSVQTQELREASSLSKDPRCFPIANWFSMDGSCKGSATWPEERLPLDDQGLHQDATLTSTWGLVIVTAGWDGMIRTFHNYGLPINGI